MDFCRRIFNSYEIEAPEGHAVELFIEDIMDKLASKVTSGSQAIKHLFGINVQIEDFMERRWFDEIWMFRIQVNTTNLDNVEDFFNNELANYVSLIYKYVNQFYSIFFIFNIRFYGGSPLDTFGSTKIYVDCFGSAIQPKWNGWRFEKIANKQIFI